MPGEVKIKKGAGLHRRSFPITRTEQLEDGRLLVEGTCTTEAVVDGIVLDYDAMCLAAETNYKGNLREMHNRVAVGRAIEVMPDAESRSIRLRAFVSKGAPETQAKVLDGTLAGFSVGVDPVEMSKVNGIKRATKIDWAETSLVDVGADPNTNDLALVTLCRGAEYTPALVGKEEPVAEKKIEETPAVAAPPVNRFKDILRAAAEEEPPAKAEETRAGDCTCGCAECGTGQDGDGEECDCGCETCAGKDAPDGAEEEKFRADEPAVTSAEEIEDARAKCQARLDYLDEMAKELGVETPERARRKAVIERVARIHRHSDWGTEYDDISFGVMIACSLNWVKRDLANLMAAEMGEGAEEGDGGAQIKSLQAASESLDEAIEAVDAFIGAEAAELVAEEMEEEPAPVPATAPAASETPAPSEPVANAKRARIVRNVGTRLITRRLDKLERAVTEKTVLTTTDGEQMTHALGEKLAEITRASSKAQGEVLAVLKALCGDVEIIKAQPVPGGPVRLARAVASRVADPGAKVTALEDALLNAPDPVTAGFLRTQIARAKADAA